MNNSERRPVQANDLYKVRLVSDAQISPDGRRIAFVVTTIEEEENGYRSSIYVAPVDGGEPVRWTLGARLENTPRWSPDGRLLAFVSNRPPQPGQTADDAKPKNREPGQLWILPVEGGEARQITNAKYGVSDPVWSPDGSLICYVSKADPAASPYMGDDEAPVVVQRADSEDPRDIVQVITRLNYKADGEGLVDGNYRHLSVISSEGGTPRQITDGEWNDTSPVWTPDGKAVIFLSNRTDERDFNAHADIWSVPVEGGEARQLTCSTGPINAAIPSPDGSSIVYAGHPNPPETGMASNTDLWRIPAAGVEDGTPRNLTASLDRSIGNDMLSDMRPPEGRQLPYWTPDGRALYFLAADSGNSSIYRLDIESGEIKPVIEGRRQVVSFGMSADCNWIAFVASDNIHPAEVFVARADGSDERQISFMNRGLLAELDLSEPEEFWVETTEGARVQTWVMKPAGYREGKRYPTILQIHGGPHALYGNTFFHELQLMAARGYMVVYSNPRGSQGYGVEHTNAITRNWGERDYTDLMCIVDRIIERPDVDAERLGVTGGSYGGYMTNWIIGHTDRFKAAVTMRSLTNFVSFWGTSDIGPRFAEFEVGGMPLDNIEEYIRMSPITYARNVVTPLMIIHNERDDRCPMEQAEQWYVALKRLKKEVIFVRVPEENHNLSRTGRPRRRIERLNQILGWFDKYLEPHREELQAEMEDAARSGSGV